MAPLTAIRSRAGYTLIAAIVCALLLAVSFSGLAGVAGSAADQAGTSHILDFLYFTNFETEDPGLYEAPAGCVGRYHSEWAGKSECGQITFFTGDTVEGPMHTNDAARVEGSPSFGRPGAQPPDVVEIDGGTYPEDEDQRCTGTPIFHTAGQCYVEGEQIPMPAGPAGLEAFAHGEDDLSGETRLELNGDANTIRVVNFNEAGVLSARTINWPSSGLIYVKSEFCGWPTAISTPAFNADGGAEDGAEKGCGNIYVRGTYSRPLTIAAQDDVIIDGSIYPTSVAGHLGQAPTGSATLGLIAGDYVRIYHPVSSGTGDTLNGCSASNLGPAEDRNGWGSQADIWVYAAILATDHSFMVDNFSCGAPLGTLHVYGAVAQNYRGIIGTAGGNGANSGYAKDYTYDGRLASEEPPDFLVREGGECPLAESTIPLVGARGVHRKPFEISISSLGIRDITFYLDGRAFTTLTAAQARHHRFTVRINPRRLSRGIHTVSLETIMDLPGCAPLVRNGVFLQPRGSAVPPHAASRVSSRH